MKSAADALDLVHDNRMATQTALATIKSNYLSNRLQILLMFQHAPDSPLAAIHDHPVTLHLDALSATRQINNDAAKIVESRNMDDTEQSLVNTMVAARKAWQVKRDLVLKAIQQGDYSPATMNAFLIAGRTEGSALEKALEALITYQEKSADHESDLAESRYQTAKWVFAVIVLGGALPMMVVMVLTMRRLAKGFEVADNVATSIAGGNLTERIDIRGQDEISRLLSLMGTMQHTLREHLQSVVQSADSIATASDEVASGTHDLSARTEQQASSLQQTASATEQLNSTVRLNADNATQANHMAQSASVVEAKGGEVVAEVVRTMDEINRSSRKIVDIIGVIDGIAFQTNILALNAAVEAARAGEQGRGFAVVASEVRSLAQRSASAAKEIKELIDESVSRVDGGTRLVAEAGDTMKDVVDSIERVTQIVRDIELASKEQADGISQINQAVTQMDSVTQQNAALVEEASAAAATLHEQAARLKREVGSFTL